MIQCNRCGSLIEITMDNRCSICGPIPLCPGCWVAHEIDISFVSEGSSENTEETDD